MATIIAFPRDAAMRRASAAAGDEEPMLATVTILPVVRIERHDDMALAETGQETPPPRGRRRRARQ